MKEIKILTVLIKMHHEVLSKKINTQQKNNKN